ncbi:MAG: VWA domain-containing protein, partial [Clostridia bacterium]|nr:VWA domain-containing protein [Clostridia bacterium]
MTFLYPLGLLGLIGIPLLILIYIIKSKYTEQTVSSTYLWTLSERFLKRKNPISRLTGIISLILQILAVAVISLAIAHPIITVPNSANEYCFILDASASMNMESDGVSRFESGKDRIMDIISDSVDGSVFSLICVGDTTNVIFERLEDKEQAEILLRDVEVAYNADDYTDALGVAQGYFNENSSVLTYLVTDKAYRSNTNISLINVSSDEENYAVSDVTHTFKDGKLTVNGFVTSYRSAATLSLKLYIDESEQPVSGNTVVVKQSVPTAFQITCNTDRFSEYRVAIENEDSLALDNSFIFNDIKSESSYDTLIVSDKPFFIRSAIESLMNARIDVIGTEEYKEQSGYGLYIFDAFVPETLPRDGSVWMLSPEGSVPEAGFSVQDKEELGRGELLEMNGSSASAVKKLTAELSGDGIYVAKYVKCGLYRNFTTVLSYKGNPLLFAGTNSYGNRQVVFAFDLHDSNLPLLLDYLVLTRNLLDYSFPEVVEK